MSDSGRPGRGGPDDDAAGEVVLLAELPDDAAQPAALVARFDLARDADVVDRRHEDEEAARDRRVTGDARALGAERLLHHLDQHLLPFLEELVDRRLPRPAACRPLGVAIAPARPPSLAGSRDRGRRRRAPRPSPGREASATLAISASAVAAVLSASARLELLELLGGADDVRDVQEAVALEPEVDEGRLHAGQHLRDAALVDVADDAPIALALDEELDHLVVLEDGDHRLVVVRGDNHLLVHGGSPRGPSARAVAAAHAFGHAECEIAHTVPQLVKRRIRTFRMSPKAASVAMIDDPP